MPQVLLIDDDVGFAQAMATLLQREGHTVVMEHSLAAGVQAVLEHDPDLVVVDLILGDGHGFDACLAIRRAWQGPLLFLTGLDDEEHQLEGLSLGADDYIAKGNSPRLILARIHAVLRRLTEHVTTHARHIILGEISYDRQQRCVRFPSGTLRLSAASGEIFEVLLRRSPAIVERQELARLLYGLEDGSAQRSIDQRISRLRRQLELQETPLHIVANRGQGYGLIPILPRAAGNKA